MPAGATIYILCSPGKTRASGLTGAIGFKKKHKTKHRKKQDVCDNSGNEVQWSVESPFPVHVLSVKKREDAVLNTTLHQMSLNP